MREWIDHQQSFKAAAGREILREQVPRISQFGSGHYERIPIRDMG